MLSKRLCILLPIRGREDCVKEYLEHSLGPCRESGIDLYLCDSSDTEANRLLAQEYIQQGYENLHYMPEPPRTAPSAPDYRAFPNPDHKVFAAQLILAEKYDYIWLCGDNCLLDFQATLPQVQRCMEQGADILHFDDSRRMPLGETRVYTDAREFYADDAWHMTAYGVSLVSSRVIKGMNTSGALEKFLDSGFLYTMSLMDYCARNPFTAIHAHQRFFRDNPRRQRSGWVANGTALEVFCGNWTLANRALDAVYDGQKADAIRSHSQYTGLFGMFGCVRMRASGNLTVGKLRSVRAYLPGISDTPVWWYYLLCLCPQALASFVCALRKPK